MLNRFKKLNTIQSFQLFCLESYRSNNGIAGQKALSNFKKARVFSFLAEGYDVLHTQSQHFIVSEINRYIKRYNETLSRKY